MTNDEYQAETIRAALAGDAEAGREALDLCRHGLSQNRLSPALRDYLCARISDVLDGAPLAKALCIAKERGRPKDPLPVWEQELAAFAALLEARGYKPQQVAVAMCDERRELHDLTLDESDAHRIRKTWALMREVSPELLQRLAGQYWEVLSKYPPRT